MAGHPALTCTIFGSWSFVVAILPSQKDVTPYNYYHYRLLIFPIHTTQTLQHLAEISAHQPDLYFFYFFLGNTISSESLSGEKT